jgi:uncharacterized protein (TIGR00251 family)
MLLRIKITPNASRSGVIGWEEDPVAGRLLKVRIQAPPIDGKANKALTVFLAKELRLPKPQVTLKKGQTSRIKTIELPDGTTLPTSSQAASQ